MKRETVPHVRVKHDADGLARLPQVLERFKRPSRGDGPVLHAVDQQRGGHVLRRRGKVASRKPSVKSHQASHPRVCRSVAQTEERPERVPDEGDPRLVDVRDRLGVIYRVAHGRHPLRPVAAPLPASLEVMGEQAKVAVHRQVLRHDVIVSVGPLGMASVQ